MSVEDSVTGDIKTSMLVGSTRELGAATMLATVGRWEELIVRSMPGAGICSTRGKLCCERPLLGPEGDVCPISGMDTGRAWEDGYSSGGDAFRLGKSVSPIARNHNSDLPKSSKSCSISCSTCLCANMTLRRTFLWAPSEGGDWLCVKPRIISTCFFDIDERVGWGAGLEKYRSLIIDISSLTVARVVRSCTGSSSSSDEAESIDSKGFLKLSTVSQNWTSIDR